MAKHKPLCWVVSLLVIIGGINWGLVGIGGFAGTNLNLVNLILGSMPQVEWIVYILVGLASLAYGGMWLGNKDCACNK